MNPSPDQILVLPQGEPTCPSDNCLDLHLAGRRDCGAHMRLELTGPVNLITHTTPAASGALRHRSRLTAVLPLRSIRVVS